MQVHCRNLVAIYIMDTQLFVFFNQLTTCTCWTAQWLGLCWRGLTEAELADSRRTSPETQKQIWNWLRQLPPSTPVVHYLQTVHCWLPLRQLWQKSCILSSRLMTTPYVEEILPTRFQETAQSEQHWHSDADIEGFICRKLKVSTNAHLVRCLKMGAKGMFCYSQLQVK